MKLTYSLFAFVFIFSIHKAGAQISVTPNLTANALINRLAGAGITYSNALLTCPLNASGKFDNGLASSILVDSGIVLTTGRALTNGASIGVNGIGSDFASVNNNTNGGDANLATAAGTSTNNIHDLCKLEFDFIPTGDTIQFRYRFGSEEYPMFNCTEYNDIFAFFISGPGYATPTNVALVPGTTIPVSINSINNGTVAGGTLSNCTSLGTGSPFTSLYVNNSASTSITYNGLTTLLTAKAAVTPCSTYHMKFAIADLSDHIYDSGVFLQAGSFISQVASVVNVTSTNTLGGATPYAVEGCTPATITIARPQAKPYPQTVTYTLSGTATNGVDVTSLSGSAVIPAFGTTTSITINAIQDGIAEGTETLVFAINGTLCGNTVTETLTVEIRDYPTYLKPVNDTICQGQSISLQVIPVPANPNLSFSWSPSSSLTTSTGTSVIASPMANTTYTVTSSYAGCPAVDSVFTLSVEPLPTLNLVSTPVSCSSLGNGSIVASGTVGSSPFLLSLNPGGQTATVLPKTFNNLSAGTYTVVVSSAAGCTKSTIAAVSAPSPVTWVSTLPQNPTCSGSTNGSIQVNATGGTGVINYTLQPGGTNNTTGIFPSLGAGAYSITASDANGCSISTLVSLTVNNAVTLTNSTVTPVAPCYGLGNGAIAVTASGGTGALTYILNPGGVTNGLGTFPSLNPGNYVVTVSDANGCTVTTSLVVTQPAQVQFTNVSHSNVTCFGNMNASIQAGASGGTGTLQFTLLPGGLTSTGNFTGFGAGTYTIKVADASGCSATTQVAITQPPVLQFTSVLPTHVHCNNGNDGAVNASAAGGFPSYTYSLLPSGVSNTSGVFSGLTAATYIVKVTDANGCTITSSVSITQPVALSYSPAVITHISCFNNQNGQVQLTANGGTGSLVYQMLPGPIYSSSGAFNALNAGSYTIIVSDAVGCTLSTSLSITQPPLLQWNAVTLTNPVCTNLSNGSVTVGASGGTAPYQYALNNGAFSALTSYTGLSAGSYTIHIKDNKNCTKDSVVNLLPASNVTLTNITITAVPCTYDSTGAITLNAAGGVSPYSFTVNGTASGSSGNFSNLPAGTYSIVVSDNLGCLQDTVLTVTEPLNPLGVGSVSITNILCYGSPSGSIGLSGSGGSSPYQYAFNGGGFGTISFFGGLGAGTFLLTIKDSHGCLTDTILTVKQPLAPLNLTLKNVKPVSCIGLSDGALSFGAAGGVKPYTFTLNGGVSSSDSTFSGLMPGVYTVEVKDSNGCKFAISLNIPQPERRPYIVVEEMTGNVCKGDQTGMINWTTINGFPPYHYTVNAGFIDTISQLGNLASGAYLIEVNDSLGCRADTTITIANSTSLSASISTVPASCDGKGDDGIATALVSGGQPPYTYTWIGASGQGSSIGGLTFGDHIFIVRDLVNCSDTLNFVIDYQPCCEVYMPNAFSPNDDGQNDTYRPIHYGQIDVKSFEIFDRWGNKIFSSNSEYGEWDGKYKGADCEIGTYYYIFKYYCQNHTDMTLKAGDITLLR